MDIEVPTRPLLELRFFGQPSVFVEGTDVTASLSKRALWLMAVLALREGKPLDRRQLAGVLWPESSDTAALHNLRQTLAAIRRSLGHAKGVVQAGSPRSLIMVTSPDVTIDVVEFDAACSAETAPALERAIELYREPLLIGCDEPFAILAREAREHAFLAAAEKLAAHHISCGDHASALPVLRRILTEDPYRESACRSLMAALSEMGHGPAALEWYREFRARLRKELKTDVSSETRAAYRAIRERVMGQDSAHPAKRPKRRIPMPLTGLVGRREELKEVVDLLDRCRLVTLAGPGGVGKTRMALAVAEEIEHKYLDGAWFVDLVPVQDLATAATAIAAALQIRETAGTEILESISEYVAGREMLLVLDNCEHVTQDLAAVIERLLSASAGLHVLATSRQTIGVRGECVWNVPALGLPRPSDRASAVAGADSVRLFLERSRRAHDVTDNQEMEAIASVCRRLDGLPLAIELAAARTSVLSAREIESRLSDRFSLLTAGGASRGRHQTLQECIQWSWDLLSPDERALLSVLSVFRGGCSLPAIEYVASEQLAPETVLDHLASLVDRSLVRTEIRSLGGRYGLLETVREFAEKCLRESEGWQSAHARHRDYFMSLAKEAYRPMTSVEEAKKFELYEADHDNMRAAIAWCYREGDGARAVRLCAALSRFWDTCGHMNEGRAALESAMRQDTSGLSDEVRARAHVHAGWMAASQGDHHAAIRHYEAAIPISRDRQDKRAMAVAINCLASVYSTLGDFSAAQPLFEEALMLNRSRGNKASAAMILSNLAEAALEQGKTDEALARIEEALREMGGPSPDSAEVSGLILRNFAFVEYRCGRYLEARSHILAAIRLFKDAGLRVDLPFALLVAGLVESAFADWERTVQMMGACESLAASQGTPLPQYLARAKDEVMAEALARLDKPDFDRAHGRGRVLGFEAASSLSLSPPGPAAEML